MTDTNNKRADYFSPETGKRTILLRVEEYLAADVAFVLMTGKSPIGEVIHKDGDVNNLRWDNLVDTGAAPPTSTEAFDHSSDPEATPTSPYPGG